SAARAHSSASAAVVATRSGGFFLLPRQAQAQRGTKSALQHTSAALLLRFRNFCGHNPAAQRSCVPIKSGDARFFELRKNW
ncbi:MAG TPA: hypothetical protein VGM54_01240, partial [Chthoniobacter sp.]